MLGSIILALILKPFVKKDKIKCPNCNKPIN